jgi:galactose oxidase-like protein
MIDSFIAPTSWTLLPVSSEVLAVHAALLPNGQILYFSGDETDRELHDRGDYDHSRLFDPTTGLVARCGSPTTDVFCCGHAMLPDGRLLVAGGIEDGAVEDFFLVGGQGLHAHHAPGNRATWVFDPEMSTWLRLADMNAGPVAPVAEGGDPTRTGGRWYPTLVTLASGEVLIMSGHPSQGDARHNNNTPEVFPCPALGRSSWFLLPAVGSDDIEPDHTYPRLFALPDGSVFSLTPFRVGARNSHRYDPVAGTLVDVCTVPTDPGDPPNATLEQQIYLGYHCSAALLPLRPSDGYRPRVLICNGQQPYVIDLASAQPTWNPTAPRSLSGSPSRWNATAVLLPTGHVLINGGVRLTMGTQGPELLDDNAVLSPELFDSDNGVWSTLPPGSVPRNYHSSAVVLPDGRVWTAGSNKNTWLGAAFVERRIEILSPWYCYPTVDRPVIINAPSLIRPAQTFELHASAARSIVRIALLRTGSVTHCFSSDQRYIVLDFHKLDTDHFMVIAPPDARIAPPGYYLLFAIDEAGAPSVGRFVRIPALPHWVRHFRLSYPISGSRVTAVSTVPGGVSLFLVDQQGAVQSSYFDPRVPNPQWAPWFRLTEDGCGQPGAAAATVSSVPGGASIFFMDRQGAVQSSYFDPRLET